MPRLPAFVSLTAACGVWTLLSACSSIPELHFADMDAEADVGPDSTQAEGGADAAPGDGDAGPQETGPSDAGGCPGVVPPGAALCCGAVPCYGKNCGGAACTDCEGKCSPGVACCPNQGGKATCLADASLCP